MTKVFRLTKVFDDISECIDVSEHCSGYVEDGLCSAQSVKDLCRKSCDVCTGKGLQASNLWSLLVIL